MGYIDTTVRVFIDVLAPLYVLSGPAVYSIHFSSVGYTG